MMNTNMDLVAMNASHEDPARPLFLSYAASHWREISSTRRSFPSFQTNGSAVEGDDDSDQGMPG